MWQKGDYRRWLNAIVQIVALVTHQKGREEGKRGRMAQCKGPHRHIKTCLLGAYFPRNLQQLGKAPGKNYKFRSRPYKYLPVLHTKKNETRGLIFFTPVLVAPASSKTVSSLILNKKQTNLISIKHQGESLKWSSWLEHYLSWPREGCKHLIALFKVVCAHLGTHSYTK